MPTPARTDVDERILALLDCMAGDGAARGIVRHLIDGAEPPKAVASRIAASVAFERLYKLARTLDIGEEGPKHADPEFVGLPHAANELSFNDLFQNHFRPRLGNRADGFGVIFDALLGRSDLLIVETGSMRIPGNWEGDGQSTFMFDALVQRSSGLLFSIDITLNSIDTARRACSSSTQLILNNSVAALYALTSCVKKQASLLYFDSFDLDIAQPLPSAIHHIMELTAARALVGPGTIVCVDDYALGSEGGKGMILDKFFYNISAKVLHSGYQKVWLVP